MNIKEIFQEIRRSMYYLLVRNLLYIKNDLLKIKIKNQFLFILSPPFSGSTLLNQIICTSKNVSCNNNLGTREGQLLPNVKQIMFTKDRWSEKKNYNWKKIKKIWMKYWDKSKPILLEKSIQNIMYTKEIKKEFQDVFFIGIIRNPYALCEGIIRRNPATPEYAAKFVLNCFKQLKKIKENEKQILFLSYEDLCEKSNTAFDNIKTKFPELNDIKTDLLFSAHNFKSKKMKVLNLNNEKISRLSKNQIQIINSYFIKEKETLNFFNYKIISKD